MVIPFLVGLYQHITTKESNQNRNYRFEKAVQRFSQFTNHQMRIKLFGKLG